MAAIKLSPVAAHLLARIAKGQNRVFVFSEKPAGWVGIERAGLAVRDPNDDSRALLTDKGREQTRGV